MEFQFHDDRVGVREQRRCEKQEKSTYLVRDHWGRWGPWQGQGLERVVRGVDDVGDVDAGPCTEGHVEGDDVRVATVAILRLLVRAGLALTVCDSPPLDVGKDTPVGRL